MKTGDKDIKVAKIIAAVMSFLTGILIGLK